MYGAVLQAVRHCEPDDGGKYPLISFAHGLSAWNVPVWFPQLLSQMAAEGYVVVAPMAGLEWCLEQSKDQIRALQWALADPQLKEHIDASKGTGIVGECQSDSGAHSCLAPYRWTLSAAAPVDPANS